MAVLASRPHPEQGFRTCLGVLRLFRGLEATAPRPCRPAPSQIGALTYKSVASILANQPRPPTRHGRARGASIDHANLRGPGYFH